MRMLALMRALPLALAAGLLGGCGGDDANGALDSLPVAVVGGGAGEVPAAADNLPPAAVISASQLAGTQLSVTFNGAASIDSDGRIVEHRWTFGDGATATGTLVSHLYAAPGAYVVTLTVTDDGGAADTASVTVSIGGTLADNLAPGAAFTPTPRSGSAPLSVTFDGTLSEDADGLIVEYRWNFGDGTAGTGPLVSHTYTTAGIYSVQLTVIDDDGARSTASQTVVVSDEPEEDTGAGTGIGIGSGTTGGGTVTVSTATAGSVGADGRAVHRLRLGAGEAVELTFPVERAASTDLDLHLFDMSDPQRPVHVGSSVGLGDREVLVAPAAGEFALLVEAVGAGSDYQLRVGGQLRAQMPTLADDFRAGELLLRRHAGEAAPLPPGLTPVEERPEGALLVRLSADTDTVEPFWTGQPLQQHYLTMRRFKQLGLDPAVAAVALVPSGPADPTDR